MLGMRNNDASPDDGHVTKEGQTNRRNKWQSQPPKRSQHSVTFLSVGWSEEVIRGKFSQCGDVTDIHTSHNRTFVRYNTEEEAKAAEKMFRDELGASIAIKKEKNQKTADGGKNPKIPSGPNDKIEVRVLRLNKSALEEEACDEILHGANHKSFRFRIAQDCNMMYVDFSTREDAQRLIDTWHQKEWRDNTLSVHFVEKKPNQANSGSRGQKRGDRQFSGQSRRRPELEMEENAYGGVPRRESWEDNEPETSHSDYSYPGKGSTQDSNNNSSKFSGGEKWEQQESHRNSYNGDDQDREYGAGPRSPKNGAFSYGGARSWLMDDSSSPRKFSNSRSMQGGGGSQDGRQFMKNQEWNGSRGNSLTYGGINNKPIFQQGSEQSEAPLGEKGSHWKHPSTPVKQQGRRGHNGPSPRKLSCLSSYSDSMPPLETLSLGKENPGLDRSPSPHMPVLEAVRNPVALPSDSAMPPLEMAAWQPSDAQPQPFQAAALPAPEKQIEGLIITNLPGDSKDLTMVVEALLMEYKWTDINAFSKSAVFVKFQTQEEAKRACAQLDNYFFCGKRLSVILQYEKSSNELRGGSASAIKQQGTKVQDPLQKTWEDTMKHYKVIAKKIGMNYPPKPGQTLHVRITHIANEQCFWAQNMSSKESMERLMGVSHLERLLDHTMINRLEPATGGRCCAPYGSPGQELYYRAWVLSRPGPPLIPVFFVDYGNIEIVPKDVVWKRDSKFWEEPALALPFRLREGDTQSLRGIDTATLMIHKVDETHTSICSVIN